jgi:uncharacterized protein with PhoU and TrkA domain
VVGRGLRSALSVARSRRGVVGELRLGIELGSRLVGALERGCEAGIIVVREGRLVRNPDAVLQAGDHLIAVGPASTLSELLKNA